MIASSISSPPTRRLWETTMPPSEITATSLVPPPMSTIMFPAGVHLARPRVDRDNGRLGEHDAAAADVDQRVGSPEVHGHVAAAEARERVEEGHDGAPSLAACPGRSRPLALLAEAVPAGEA